MAVYLVIFGAAVRPDGSPSGSLLRRVEGALRVARGEPNHVFVVTGGQGRHGPPEAHVMRNLLQRAGVADRDILVEDQATDTLESVIFCHAKMKSRTDLDTVIPCSSGYHNLRCAVLFSLLGYRTKRVHFPSDLPHLGFRKWLTYVLKEFFALPYDALLLMLKRNK
jgi:uncharacterized SAM-binding protein YcdF (DUF218 family)